MTKIKAYLKGFFKEPEIKTILLSILPLLFIISIVGFIDWLGIDNYFGKEISTINILGIIAIPYTIIVTVVLFQKQKENQVNWDELNNFRKNCYNIISTVTKISYWLNYLKNNEITQEGINRVYSNISQLEEKLVGFMSAYAVTMLGGNEGNKFTKVVTDTEKKRKEIMDYFEERGIVSQKESLSDEDRKKEELLFSEFKALQIELLNSSSDVINVLRKEL